MILPQHTSILGKNGSTDSPRAPSSSVSCDHTWNPGHEPSAVRLKTKCGPKWYPPRHCPVAFWSATWPACSRLRTSSSDGAHLHVDVDNNSNNNPWGKRKGATFSNTVPQTLSLASLSVSPPDTSQSSALSQLFQIIPLGVFITPSQTDIGHAAR